MRALAISLTLASLLVGGCGSASSGLSGSPTSHHHRACGRIPARSTSYHHVVWIWMENHGYDESVGSGSMPYLTRLAHRCGIATHYHSIGHPSLPNYIAATSGLRWPALDRFRSDCSPSSSCSTGAASIFAQAPTWRAYEQSMPAPCSRRDSGEYAVRHNPPPYYRSLAHCARADVPLSALGSDLASGGLPAFSFITPNLCNDSHSCSVAVGDQWLARKIPKLVRSRPYRRGHTVIFITYDEGTGSAPYDCGPRGLATSCHVATVVVSPSTKPGTRAGRRFNHYSLLRTTEGLLGLRRLRAASKAVGMASAFGL